MTTLPASEPERAALRASLAEATVATSEGVLGAADALVTALIDRASGALVHRRVPGRADRGRT